MIIFSALFLAVVISIDTLAAGFAYGANSIKVPLRHIIVFDIISSVTVGIALFFGYIVGNYMPPAMTLGLSIGILVFLGCYKLLQCFITKVKGKTISPRQISWAETITLAVGLSLDGLAVGIGVSIHNVTLVFCLVATLFSLVIDLIFFIIGHRIGDKTTKKTRLDLSWLSGVVLIFLGLLKLF